MAKQLLVLKAEVVLYYIAGIPADPFELKLELPLVLAEDMQVDSALAIARALHDSVNLAIRHNIIGQLRSVLDAVGLKANLVVAQKQVPKVLDLDQLFYQEDQLWHLSFFVRHTLLSLKRFLLRRLLLHQFMNLIEA